LTEFSRSRWLSARLFKGGWPGAFVVNIEDRLRYHLQGANATDKNVVSYTKQKLMISATTLPT
jgi:hypothetical protein